MSPAGDISRPDQQLRHGPTTSKEEWSDLRRSLDGLSQLAAGRVPLNQTLTSIAEFAVRAIPGAEGAGLTLLERDRADTMVATAEFVSAVDDIQYSLRQGPCISAAEEGVTVQAPALGADSRWPLFGVQVARLGVHSALSLPLITPDGLVGAMNIYAQPEYAFSDPSVELGELFAVPAAIAVQNAKALADAQRLVTQLRHKLSSRSLIDQAVGILVSRSGASIADAYTTIETMSATQHQDLDDVAQTIVDAAARRARARRPG
jgi:GAF domain-containing protein